jgi:ABC-type transporter Mla subunit MlaD
MLNDDTANLKSHLKSLHANLAQTNDVDEELQSLLHQLDGDIRTLLDKRTAAAAAVQDADSDTYGLAERTQELTARFAVEHPRLEPALRELGRMLANMGI